MGSNKMTVNVDKTLSIVFSNRSISNDLNIIMNDKSVNNVKRDKFFGLIVDDRLTSDEHIRSVCSKLSKTIGIFYKRQPYLHESV